MLVHVNNFRAIEHISVKANLIPESDRSFREALAVKVSTWAKTDFSATSTSAKLYGMYLGVEEPLSNALRVVEYYSANQYKLIQNEDSFHAKCGTLKPKGDELMTLAVPGDVIRTDHRHPGSLMESH